MASPEPIEKYIELAMLLIGAAAEYASGQDQSRPHEEVSADIRRLRTITAALSVALDRAAAFAPPFLPPPPHE